MKIEFPKAMPFRYNESKSREQSKLQTRSKLGIKSDEVDTMLKDENSRLKELVGALKCTSAERSNKDIEVICTYLRRIESFKRFCTEALLTLIEMTELSIVKKGTMN